jgi:hypothetical protein
MVELLIGTKIQGDGYMKKVIFILAATLMTTLAFAADNATQTSSNSNDLYLGVGTGLTLPSSNWDPSYTAGLASNVFVGQRVDKNWAGQVSMEEYIIPGSLTSNYNLRGLAEAKYTFDMAGWQPYALGGVGAVYQFLANTGDSTVNFDAVVGLGAQADLGRDIHLYVQAEYNFIFTSSLTLGDVPITAGVWLGL